MRIALRKRYELTNYAKNYRFVLRKFVKDSYFDEIMEFLNIFPTIITARSFLSLIAEFPCKQDWCYHYQTQMPARSHVYNRMEMAEGQD